jgi:hypothetical protein
MIAGVAVAVAVVAASGSVAATSWVTRRDIKKIRCWLVSYHPPQPQIYDSLVLVEMRCHSTMTVAM